VEDALTGTQQNLGRLRLVLGLTTTYLVVEVIGGLWTGSLALLADAGHMLTDAGALALALFAARMARRRPTPEKTYGYYRAEILAALANAIVLLLISGYILYEAYRRFTAPPEVLSLPMLAVATVGLLVNLVGMILLREAAADSLNVRGAYLEVLSDLLGSLGAIAAGLVMWQTGWYLADPIVSAGIGLFIIPRTWKLLTQAVDVLMEGAPAHLNVAEIARAIREVPGVRDVHDLHVWRLTSGLDAASAHVLLADGADAVEVVEEVGRLLEGRFGVAHAAIQPEREDRRPAEVAV
jgi:cobalt-zinc-cadmium efflux system protein